MCIHDSYHIDKCKEFNILYFEQLVRFNDAYRLNITEECSKHCKLKMIKIFEITMSQYMDLVVNYYKDAKVGEDSEISDYFWYCIDHDSHEDEDNEMVESVCNVKYEHGKVIHTNPIDDSEESGSSTDEQKPKKNKK